MPPSLPGGEGVWGNVPLLCPFDNEMASGSSGGGLLPSDQLVVACLHGDLLSAQAAVAEGASINDEGHYHGDVVLPLKVAAMSQHTAVVVWLLSLFGDPNGESVMGCGACYGTSDILRLLIKAGGDVNRASGGAPPLFHAICGNNEDTVRVLLAEPTLDMTATWSGQTADMYARHSSLPTLADLIVEEVSADRRLHTRD